MIIKTPDGIGQNHKIIGIIGVAPWSALEFIKILYEQVDVTKDWHYPRVICDFNTKIPSRGRHFDLGEEDFSQHIKENIISLKNQGAKILVVLCNTAHLYFNRWGREDEINGDIEILHIVDECINDLKNLNVQKVSFLSGLSLWKSNMYQSRIKNLGIDLYELEEKEANLIYEIILDIKRNSYINKNNIVKIESLFEKISFNQVDTVLLGCTELSPIYSLAQRYFKNIVDSNSSLAKAILKKTI